MAKRSKGRSVHRNDVKKTNKTRNKMAKRGLLKKKDRRLINAWNRRKTEPKRLADSESMHMDLEKTRRSRDASSDEEEEDALPFDMVDSEDEWSKIDPDFEPPSKRSHVDYDEQPRSFGKMEHGRLKNLLPIKNKDGCLVSQSMFVKEEEDDEEIDAESATDSTQENGRIENVDEFEDPPSVAELYAKREKFLDEYKQRIASTAFALIENPQERIHKLKELVLLVDGESIPLMIRFTVQKLAMASLAEVLADIIPGYKIRLLTEEEKHQQMKKETRQLAVFEEALLRNYKKYLQLLEKCVKRLPKKGSNTDDGNIRRKDTLGKLAVQSLSKLLTAHPHFNFRPNIITVLTPLMSHWEEENRESACNAIEQLFRSDRNGEASLDAVKSVCQYAKNNPKTTHNRMLLSLLHLRIKDVEKKDARGKTKKELIMDKRKRILSMSRKEKKMQKRLNLLENELREAEVEENTNAILKTHTQIMNQVFATFFRILRRSQSSKLLPSVLAGLSKFAHFINVEFVDEVVTSLRELVDSENLKPLEKLHCIRTVFVILSGEGQALTLDPYRFYVNLYAILPRILQEKSRAFQLDQFSTAFECLDLMINKRRKQVSLSRVSAFTKRICQLCLIMVDSECVASLVAIRSFFIAHPQLECLLDEDERMSGVYRPELDDPEYCNALGTTIVKELDLLSRHPNDTVKQLALHLRYKLPSQGRHRLSADLVTTLPSDVMVKFESSTSQSGNGFVTSKATVTEKLKRFGKNVDQSVIDEMISMIIKMMKFA